MRADRQYATRGLWLSRMRILLGKRTASGNENYKIRYKVIENGPCTIDSQQSWVYEIYPDGRCKEYIYQGQNRKYQFKTEEKVSEKKAYRLACSLQKILGAPLWEKNIVEGQVCDGYSYNLQITYADKRKEIINGDVAGGTFDSILEKFVHSVFPE